MESLGERIAKARNQKGLSQEEFANQVGVSRQMVSKWELNTAVPKISRMERICELLGLTANELIYGKDPKKEVVLEKDQTNCKVPVAFRILKFKTIIKSTAIILSKIFVVLLILYIAYVIYKFAVLKHVISKVSQYENENNYYCKIRSFDESEKESIKEVWYKDGIYKIIETVNINETDVKTTVIVDFNNNCRYQIDENNKMARKRDGLSKYGNYKNGSFMYSYFPIETSKNYDYISTAFKINKVLYYKKDNRYCLEINNRKIHLSRGTYLPIIYIEKNKRENIKNEFPTEYDIKLNIVQDKDIQIPNDYNIK